MGLARDALMFYYLTTVGNNSAEYMVTTPHVACTAPLPTRAIANRNRGCASSVPVESQIIIARKQTDTIHR